VKRKVEVTLLGQGFTLKSEKDEAYLHQVATYVNRKLDELKHQTRTKEPQQLALLVALNIADELFQSEERSGKARKDLRARSERLLKNLDAALAEVSSSPQEKTSDKPALSAPEATA
jgi:cell division protein ZapA (FtsZ GTPase activity inhibitor)